MIRSRTAQWCNLASYSAVIVFHLAVAFFPLGGLSTGQLSDKYHTLITPADYTFTVWTVIYGLLAGWVLYPLLRNKRDPYSIPSMPLWFLLSCLLNIAWLASWQLQRLPLSLAAMLLLLAVLAAMYRRTRRTLRPAAADIWLVRLPFTLYFGWIGVAALVNIQAVLVHALRIGYASAGYGSLLLPILLLSIGLAAACLIGFRARDGLLPLVYAWGYAAIMLEQQAQRAVAVASGALALGLVVYALRIAFLRAHERD
ncbi:tryptophan-rich sensory protein [Paenibacillus macerans]|uniref:tryptophan-rich sensory protein n=1 Tax=Paenibacillus macerans TaxID=44252 RepID=UPI003D3154C4